MEGGLPFAACLILASAGLLPDLYAWVMHKGNVAVVIGYRNCRVIAVCSPDEFTSERAASMRQAAFDDKR